MTASTPAAGAGTVHTNLRAGEVFLAGPQETLRLSWTRGGEPGDRAVPAGTYRWLGYRVVDGDWLLSTAGGTREVVVRAGQRLALEPSQAVRLGLNAVRKGEQVQLQLGVTDGQGLGLSLYVAGKRVAIRYRLTDAAGGTLAEGPLRYG